MKMMEPNADNFKLIEQAISNIDKKYGGGSVFILDSNERIQNIEVISSGSLSLDKALGVGGFPRGRVIEILGQPGGGKCFSENNYIFTEYGIKSIKKFFNDCNENLYCVRKCIPIQNSNIINENNNIEKASELHFNGRRKVFKLTTHKGYSIEVTSRHPIRVIDNTGFIGWKWIEDIDINNDYAVLCSDVNINDKDPNEEEIFKAYITGIMIADGYIDEKKVSVTNNDPDIINAILDFANRYFIECKLYSRNYDSIDIHFNGINATKVIDILKLDTLRSKDKVVPDHILCGGKSIIKSFLSGYMDCESYFDNTGGEVTSASKKLIEQIHLLFLCVGIISSLNKKNVKSYPDNEYYRIGMSGISSSYYLNRIGTRSKIKEFQVKKIKSIKENYEKMPYQTNNILSIKRNMDTDRDFTFDSFIAKDCLITLQTIKNIINYSSNKKIDKTANLILEYYKLIIDSNLFFDKIIKKEEIGLVPTFDISVPESHSFILGGILNHNTTAALQTVAEAQKLGLVCAYLDVENAMDVQYAKSIGVQTDKLLFSQPNNAEECIDIAETLIETNSIGILVIDSVAALIPKAELEGEIEDNTIALQARLMSKALRRLSSIVSKSGTVCIFINQLRDLINVSWGKKSDSPGGKALKYYASVRIELDRIGSIKNGAEIIGNRVRAKVIKNKVAAPFKEAEFDLIFGKGIDKLSEIIDLAVERKIIDKSGAWYAYKGERLGQGKEQSKTFLSANQNIVDEITKQIYTLEPITIKSDKTDDDIELGDLEIG